MKLASLKIGGRDGTLIVVSRDLTRAVAATAIAKTLQAALDDWHAKAPALAALSDRLNANRLGEGVFALDPAALAAPLPRAYQWCDGSAYVTHVDLVRKARGAEMPSSFWTDPLIYQGGSDIFNGPCDPVLAGSEEWGIDFEGEIAVITDDVPMGAAPAQARSHIKLLMLVNDVSLRNLIPNELAKGFGFFQSKPATSFSPVAATPDELGDAWDGGRLHLPLRSTLNGQWFGHPDAGVDMTFDFPTLISHVTKTRFMGAGSIVGSGTVSNADRSVGSSCIAEKRMLETVDHGKPSTPFMRFGDRIRIEMLDAQGRSVFGAIDQQIQKYPS